MPRNGSGQYSLPSANPVVTNTVISSSGWANPTLTDIAAAITDSIAADGQTVPSANLPMGNFRHTGVANAQNRTDYAAAGQVQDSTLVTLATISGTDTITATSAPPITAYAAGQRFQFLAAGANATNAVTLNINTLGAKSVTRYGAGALAIGDIPAGSMVTVLYDGTQFELQSVASVVTHGQCRLSVSSTTTLKLAPYNGNSLIINGVPQSVPSAGVTYTISGLAASTLYYVYAYMNSGTMTLEVVTTTHATGTNGVEQKSGDATRTLVGMVYTNASTNFVDSTASRTCLSWFNRESKAFQSVAGGNSTSSTSFTTISSVFNILAWADEAFFGYVCGYSNNTSATFNSAALAIDGGLVGQTASANMAASTNVPFSSQYSAFLSEGIHTESLQAAVGAGTGQFQFAFGGIVRG